MGQKLYAHSGDAFGWRTPLSGVVAIAGNYGSSIALKSDGTIWAWGFNGYGELGDGTTTQRNYAAQAMLPDGITPLSGVVAISAHDETTMALKSDGSVWTWGFNGYGELGTGTYDTNAHPTPVQATSLNGTAASSCGPHPMVLKYTVATPPSSNITAPVNGTVFSGITYTITGTAAVQSSLGIQKVEVGITPSGGPTTWYTATGTTSWTYSWTLPANGSYTIKSRATDNASNVETPGTGVTVTVDNTPPTGAISINSGAAFTTTTTATLTLLAFDTNGVSQMQICNDSAFDTGPWETYAASKAWTLSSGNGLKTVYVRYMDGAGNISATYTATITLDTNASDMTVWAWGDNEYGELGDGTTTQRNTPVQVGGLTGVTAVAGGYDHTIALKSDGTVWAWGWNAHGQLGDGTTTDRYTPVQVNGLTGVIAIADGRGHTVALKSDGTVWAWGWNAHGQVGDGTTTDRYTPVQVTDLMGVTAIAGGIFQTIVLKSDGTVWAWGWNAHGQVGDGTTTDRYTPVQVSGLTGVTAIAGGGPHTIALKSDGTVWAWGYNGFGQLGDGTTTDRYTPVQVTDLMGVTAIACGGDHTIALKSDGTVWAWGYNNYGQLGDGTTTDRYTPEQINGLMGVTAIAGGVYKSIALKSDGTVWTWGYNAYGDLGDGTTTNRNTPVQVSGLTGVMSIAGGYNHTIALALEPADTTPPASAITAPSDGAMLNGTSYIITGTATDGTGSGVQYVDVSTDGGKTWNRASGTTTWSYNWT
ncbi:MAG: hypothetical protein WA666_02575, partial [Nitrospirota bacterium]